MQLRLSPIVALGFALIAAVAIRTDLAFLRALHGAAAGADGLPRMLASGLAVMIAIGAIVVAIVWRIEHRYAQERASLEQARDAARESSRGKSEFLARMSHELRTPLNAVIGFSGVLLRNKRGALDDRDLSYLDRIQTGGTRLLTIINDILDLSKVESGRMDLIVAPVDVMRLVRETIEQFTEQLAGRDVTLAAELPLALEPLRTDAEKLQLVLRNLIANALRFTEHGRVLVRLVADPLGVLPCRIDVIDSGVGVAPERIGAIFGAFEQGETTARPVGGTGLGLAIARAVCDRLDFRLALVSEDGVGSTFSVLLDLTASAPERHLPPLGGCALPAPTHAVAVEPVRRPANAVPDAGTPLILVIDDNADSRLLLSQYIDDCGFIGIAAVGGEQGLQMALEFRPDVILLDLQMPTMDGWEVLQRLQTHRTTAEIPVIVVSVDGAEADRSRLDGADVVVKPMTRDGLSAAIRRNLRGLTGRVVVVGRAAEVATSVSAHLAEFPGIMVESCTATDEALARLAIKLPDLLIIHHAMLETDAPDFLDELRADATRAHMPVLIVVERELTPNEHDAFERHATGVLETGTRMGEELRRVARRSVQRSRSGRAQQARS